MFCIREGRRGKINDSVGNTVGGLRPRASESSVSALLLLGQHPTNLLVSPVDENRFQVVNTPSDFVIELLIPGRSTTGFQLGVKIVDILMQGMKCRLALLREAIDEFNGGTV